MCALDVTASRHGLPLRERKKQTCSSVPIHPCDRRSFPRYSVSTQDNGQYRHRRGSAERDSTRGPAAFFLVAARLGSCNRALYLHTELAGALALAAAIAAAPAPSSTVTRITIYHRQLFPLSARGSTPGPGHPPTTTCFSKLAQTHAITSPGSPAPCHAVTIARRL